ncbi:MAG: class I SAM-dependent methyltransferase [Mariniblastus sp.]
MHLSQTAIQSLRPKSVVGGISIEESYFLYNIIKTFNPKNIVEVGVASGWSSSIILTAVNDLKKANPDAQYQFRGIDIDTHCYYDKSLPVGYTIDEVLPEDAYKGEILRGNSVFAIRDHYQENEIDLIFIDANHKHPYPAIDLMAALPYLKENAVVVLHDTNLPLINQDFPSFGAKYLFDEIETQFKFNCPAIKRHNEISNMGAFVINSKEALKQEVQTTIGKFEYEMELTGDYCNSGFENKKAA